MKILKRIFIGVIVFFETMSAFSNEIGNFNPTTSTPVQYEQIHNMNDPAVIDAYTYLFADNVYHVSQQRDAQLLPYAEMLGLVRAAQSINRIGTLQDPRPVEGRMATVKGTNPPNDVRWVMAQPFYHACFVDDYDQIRTLYSLQNAYTVAIARSFGRFYDRTYIAAALGVACTGPNRTGQAALPDSQKLVAFQKTEGGVNAPTAGVGLNLQTLRQIRLTMKSNFAITRGDMLVYVVSANDTDELLKEIQVTNRDYTNALALVDGEVAAFMGMLFVETELLPHNANAVTYDKETGSLAGTNGTLPAGKGLRTFCFVTGKSVCFGMNTSLNGLITRIPQRHNNWMIYYRAEFGAVRKEEVAVMEILTLDKRVA